MEFNEATIIMEEGFCLWVGAGVSKQASGGYASVPLWKDITTDMEIIAGLEVKEIDDFPRRLQKCYDAIGHEKFHKFLRKQYYTELCKAVLIQADEKAMLNDFVPVEVRQLAALGQLANPIVSFNIEPISSLLLARPGGPVRILDSTPNGKPFKRQEPFEKFQRIVYHPHGLATDVPVMTTNQYKSNELTLAFGLAVHAAFRNNLVIVGMSLDDEYLREQLVQFRSQIERVIWFNSNFSEKLSIWANKNDITMVVVNWQNFWHRWGNLGVGIDEKQLIYTWYLAVEDAANELKGGFLNQLGKGFADKIRISSDLLKILDKARAKSISSGEPDEVFMVRNKLPNDIEMALRDRLINAGIPIPKIGYTGI